MSNLDNYANWPAEKRLAHEAQKRRHSDVLAIDRATDAIRQADTFEDAQGLLDGAMAHDGEDAHLVSISTGEGGKAWKVRNHGRPLAYFADLQRKENALENLAHQRKRLEGEARQWAAIVAHYETFKRLNGEYENLRQQGLLLMGLPEDGMPTMEVAEMFQFLGKSVPF